MVFLENASTLPESFIDETIADKKSESVAFLRKISKRVGATFIFQKQIH